MIEKMRLHSKKFTYIAIFLASTSIISPLHLSAEKNPLVELKQGLSAISSVKVEESTQATHSEWIKEGNHWYYRDQKGKKQTGWTKIDSSWYYMDSNGVMQTGWNKVGHNWYYMTGGAVQTGWTQVGKTWYYMSDGGAMQTGWTRVDNTWYYIHSNGMMQKGWQKLGNNWYYLSGSGAMQTGLTRIKNRYGVEYLYLFDSNGVLNKKRGWQKIDGDWYYQTESDAIETGWLFIGQKNYVYSIGIMYYMNENGVMQTGWIHDGEDWYYMSSSGVQQYGWQKINRNWYYFDGHGRMLTGFQEIDRKWYDFNPDGSLKAELGFLAFPVPEGIPAKASVALNLGNSIIFDYHVALSNGGYIDEIVVDKSKRIDVKYYTLGRNPIEPPIVAWGYDYSKLYFISGIPSFKDENTIRTVMSQFRQAYDAHGWPVR